MNKIIVKLKRVDFEDNKNLKGFLNIFVQTNKMNIVLKSAKLLDIDGKLIIKEPSKKITSGERSFTNYTFSLGENLASKIAKIIEDNDSDEFEIELKDDLLIDTKVKRSKNKEKDIKVAKISLTMKDEDDNDILITLRGISILKDKKENQFISFPVSKGKDNVWRNIFLTPDKDSRSFIEELLLR